MIPEKIHLDIVTPERRVVSRELDEVILPGAEGSFGVLPGHAPMLTQLAAGVAECRDGAKKSYMSISSGFVQVTPERVTVLADTCERSEEIDVDRARAKIDHYEKILRESSAETDPEILRIRLMKHLARLDASSRAS